MCLKKVIINNPVKDENRTGFDKYQLKVQCNHCVECRKQRSNDWLVRSFFEFQNNHRQAFFLSLDFDNWHLPIWQIGKGLVNKKVRRDLLRFAYKQTNNRHILRSDTLPLPDGFQPCFDTHEVQLFLKRLRYFIGPFTYFFASDYGGALKRPHYHMILLPLHHISESSFFQYVGKCWNVGKHLKIDSLESVHGSRLKAISYVCEYTTKDVSFDLIEKERCLPSRHRSTNRASKGFGYSALELGQITVDDLINNKPIALPLGKNGKLLPYQIPRYYEMKLAYDYRWSSEEKKAYLTKNQLGVEIAKNRHNADYIYYIKKLCSSRHDPDVLKKVDIRKLLNTLGFEDNHPYMDYSWKDIIFDLNYDFDSFKEFVYVRSFMPYYSRYQAMYELSSDAYQYYKYLPKNMFSTQVMLPASDIRYLVSDPKRYSKYRQLPFRFNTFGLRDTFGFEYNAFRPEWFNYAIVCCVFDLYCEQLNLAKNEIENEKSIINMKKRTYAKIRRRPDYMRYLNRINYDWNQLLT